MPAYVDTGLNLVDVDESPRATCWRSSAAGSASATSSAVRTARSPRSSATIARLVGAGRRACGCRRRRCLPLAVAAEAVARLARQGAPAHRRRPAPGQVRGCIFSSAKAERELGYRSRPAEAALRDALDWYRVQGQLR